LTLQNVRCSKIDLVTSTKQQQLIWMNYLVNLSSSLLCFGSKPLDILHRLLGHLQQCHHR